MSFNVRTSAMDEKDGDNCWDNRKETVAGIIANHRPALCGMQVGSTLCTSVWNVLPGTSSCDQQQARMRRRGMQLFCLPGTLLQAEGHHASSQLDPTICAAHSRALTHKDELLCSLVPCTLTGGTGPMVAHSLVVRVPSARLAPGVTAAARTSALLP